MSESTTPDYAGYEEEVTQTDLELLTNLAGQQQVLEQQIFDTEEHLKKLQAQHREISWKMLPELMDRINMRKFTLRNGYTVEVEEKLRASVPAKNRDAAYEWVERNGGSPLVKRAFIIAFTKEQEDWAKKFKRDCEQRKNALPMEETKTVAPPSLVKFLSDKLKAGDEVPLELFGAFRQRISKIKDK